MPKKKITPEEETILVRRQLLHNERNPEKITLKERMLQILLGIPPAREEDEMEKTETKGLAVSDEDSEEELKARLEGEAEYVQGKKQGQPSGHPE